MQLHLKKYMYTHYKILSAACLFVKITEICSNQQQDLHRTCLTCFPVSNNSRRLCIYRALQVVVLALIISYIMKRDSEVIDYEDAFGRMEVVDVNSIKGSPLVPDVKIVRA